MSVSIADLIVQETVTNLYNKWLQIANTLGLATSTWRKGDPTRTLAYYISTLFQNYEQTVSNFISGGFLDLAQGDWVFVKAEQDYGTPQLTATFASCTGNLINSGGGVFDFVPGQVVVSDSSTGKTYHNTDPVHLGALATVPITIIADEAGSASSAGAGDIDTMVSSFSNVTFLSTTDAIGENDETADETKARALLSVAAVSPNGAPDAYAYIALTPTLNGGANVTKVRVVPDSTTGHIPIYLGADNAPASGGDVTLVANAIASICTPLCMTPQPQASTGTTVNVEYNVWVYTTSGLSSGDVQALIQAALANLFKVTPIGGNVIPPAALGALYLPAVQSAIESAHPSIFRVTMVTPSSDQTAASLGTQFFLGTVTPHINFVVAP